MARKFMDIIQVTESVYIFSNPEGDVNADVPGTVVPINFWAVVNNNKEVFIVDTGFNELAEDVVKYIEALGSPKAVFATHGHLDHVLGVKVYKEIWDIPAFIDSEEIKALKAGVPPYPSVDEKMADYYEPLNKAMLEKAGLKAIRVPGHSKGNTVYYHEKDCVLLAGDMISNTETILLPPALRYTEDMDMAIDSAKIMDELMPKYVSTGHGRIPFIEYKEGMYRDLFWGFSSRK
ncbi:hypothetical protein IGL98_003221 [Enterococcus sp. DIV0840]|uniref:MBL fold metallo-hydrolase n=1 Tax=Enterococcus TaxID=1350 RepID=UPI001A8E7B23|nr:MULTISPECIES: MBL fold metallo-hydrolase [Enterococcus]MBO0436136.1 MBL fold metallo-hydrolase [Enterococcus sp. DIV0849a]MBO0475292.1 MBL fold metallo-hydrolase [Enterococcus ureasiticus]